MKKNQALELVSQYINGWKSNNLLEILTSLDDNCQIIESHGTTYYDKQDIKDWFKFWVKAESHIKKWETLSFYYLENENTAFFEWDFLCTSNHIDYPIIGISKIQFKNNKILSIHEYRMTKSAYKWNKDSLNSE